MNGARTATLGFVLAATLWAACGSNPPRAQSTVGDRVQGRASYYSDSLAGRPTASGEPYDPEALTAAHRTLRFGSVVRVRRLDNGRQVEVRINDRGPFGRRTRIIDLSRRAAESLDMVRRGVVEVEIEVLEVPPRQ